MPDANFGSAVAVARAVYDQLGPWINKYRGGMPAGFLAAAIAHESGGNFGSAGDPVLGEVGYLQVAAYVPPLFGLDPSARMDPESNIAIGALEYAMEAIIWAATYPEVNLGSADSWKLARMAFAIGRGGSQQLAELARAAQGGLTSGDVYHDIVRYVTAIGGVPLGSQSAEKVLKRVVDIDRQYAIGQEVANTPAGPPVRVPDPPAGPVTIPADIEPYFVEPIPATMLIVGGLAVLVYMIIMRRK